MIHKSIIMDDALSQNLERTTGKERSFNDVFAFNETLDVKKFRNEHPDNRI